MSDVQYTGPMTPSPTTGQPIPRITVTPLGTKAKEVDPWAAAGFEKVDLTPKPAAKVEGDPWAAAGFEKADLTSKVPDQSQRQFGTLEAGGLGALHGLTFGAAPAIAGLSEAGGTARPRAEIQADPQGMTLGDVASPFVGAAKMIGNAVMGADDPAVHDAYNRGREAALKDEQAANEQHPYAFFAGQMAGSLATPGFGAARAGTVGARALSGAVAGGVGGGLYGAGTATSEGGAPADVATRAATTAAVGAPLGGVLGATFGRRVVDPNSPGQRAIRTAADLGETIPRGLASDNPVVSASGAAVKSLPLAGAKMSRAVDRLQTAAGGRVEDIAGRMAPATDRAAADAMVRPGLQGVIDANRAAQDAGYNALRAQIDQNARFTMPRTDAALNRIMAARRAAGWTNPAQGLEQFRNVAGGATFNGAHRARVDAREAGNVLVSNPGYNAGDFNRITRAMTADLREMVQQAATRNPRRALQAFDDAEREFGRLAEQNKILHSLVNAKGEGAIGALLRAANEKGGNLRLLAQLRNSMPAHEFEVIGGTLLSELGHNNATGEFSLNQFVTRWDKLSDRAKSVLFSPGHLQNLEDIVNLGQKIKSALRTQNTSHTSNTIILFDLARDAVLMGVGIGTGAVTAAGMLPGAVAATPAVVFAHWLASPARAASMAAWSRAYGGIALGTPTPARMAAFNAATRNLANNLGVPAERIMQTIQARLAGRAEDQPIDQQK
jgi:hypothetical protein